MRDGHILFYCHAGTHFIRPVEPEIDWCLNRPEGTLSLLGPKYDIPQMADISQLGNDRRPAASPQLIELTRCKK